jgi:signal transduction histidine kinase
VERAGGLLRPLPFAGRLRARWAEGGRTPALAGYVGVLSALGLGIALSAVLRAREADLLHLLVFLLAALLTERVSVPLPRGGEFYSSTTVYVAAALLLPLPAAVLVAFGGTLGEQLWSRNRPQRLAFNVAQVTVSVAAAAFLWGWGGGADARDVPAFVERLPVAALASLVYYVLNGFFVSTVLALALGGRIWEIWWTNHRSVLLPYAGMHAMAFLVAVAWLADPRAVALLAVPAGLTWISFRHIRSLELGAETERRLRARWEALADVAERLGAAVGPDAVLRAAADLAVEYGADAAHAAAGDGAAATAARACVPTRVVEWIGRAGGDPAPEVGAFRVEPLTSGGVALGTLRLAWLDGPPSAEQEALLVPLADRVALALGNARMLRQSAEVETLREVSRARDGFLSMVGHELRTPLTLVVGYGELVQLQLTDRPGAAQMVQGMVAAGHTLTRLVENLLDAGRLGGGRFVLDRGSIDLRALADEAVERVRVGSPGHVFEVDVGPELPAVQADAVRVQQVLTNLLSNAVRYAPRGTRVVVRAAPRGPAVAVAVEDQGPGVPADLRERIFDKFYRAEGADTAAAEGLGLGLSICRDIVEAHGGRIWVEEKPDSGARFVFTLPGSGPG